MKIIPTFLSSGNAGDAIGALPAMREFYRKTGIKPTLYLREGVEAFYYEGAVHPVKDPVSGKAVMLNKQMIDMLIPLFKAQSFLEDAKQWTDEEIGVDLDIIRETNVGMPGLSLNRWFFYPYPDLACNLALPWLEIPDSEKNLAKGKVIITRTERYTNPNIDYSFLKPYEDELVFSGTMREYNNFCMSYDLNVRKLTVNTFLDLAQAIKQSRFHITNQTMANQISSGIFHPSILEVCTYAPNCIPIGQDRYDFLSQMGLEYHFHDLYGDLQPYMDKIKAAQIERLEKEGKRED